MAYVISANRLADGIVIYAADCGSWSAQLKEAKVFEGKAEAETQLSIAQNDVRHNLIVDACLVDVVESAAGLRAVTLRESIRARGPTIDFLPPRRAFAYEADSPLGGAGAREAKAGFRSPRPEDLQERELENVADSREAR